MSVIDQKSLLAKIINHPVTLLVVGLACTIAGVILGGSITRRLVDAAPDNSGALLVGAIIYAACAAGAYWLFVRFVERKAVHDFALAGAPRELLFGMGIGFAAMTVTIGVMAALGGYSVVGTNGVAVLVPILAIAITSGVGEEILLRGLVFRFTEQWLGSWAALAFSALLFGFLHLSNPNATLLAAFAISLEAGILLAAIYMVTRRLWAPIGLHAMWNFTQGGIYGADVSGFAGKGILVSRVHGSDLLTGGAFGPEASIPAMILCTGIGLWFLRRAYKDGQFKKASWQRFKGIETDQA